MTDEYKTITKTVGEGYYTEKRSKFLAFAHHVTNVDEVKEVVAEYRKKYYDARHVCYAYMLGAERTEFRANDDGEPSSTAGDRHTHRGGEILRRREPWNKRTHSSLP